MKNKLFYITSLLFLLLCEQAAAQKVYVERNKQGADCLMYKDLEQQADTLCKFAYGVSIIESAFFSESICVILEEPMTFHYLKFKKEEGKWKYQNTSGDLIRNTKNVWMPRHQEIYWAHSFEILEEDVVRYEINYSKETPDKTVIKDCKDFEAGFLLKKRNFLEYLMKM